MRWERGYASISEDPVVVQVSSPIRFLPSDYLPQQHQVARFPEMDIFDIGFGEVAIEETFVQRVSESLPFLHGSVPLRLPSLLGQEFRRALARGDFLYLVLQPDLELQMTGIQRGLTDGVAISSEVYPRGGLVGLPIFAEPHVVLVVEFQIL